MANGINKLKVPQSSTGRVKHIRYKFESESNVRRLSPDQNIKIFVETTQMEYGNFSIYILQSTHTRREGTTVVLRQGCHQILSVKQYFFIHQALIVSIYLPDQMSFLSCFRAYILLNLKQCVMFYGYDTGIRYWQGGFFFSLKIGLSYNRRLKMGIFLTLTIHIKPGG